MLVILDPEQWMDLRRFRALHAAGVPIVSQFAGRSRVVSGLEAGACVEDEGVVDALFRGSGLGSEGCG